jgi:hypothetical protein
MTLQTFKQTFSCFSILAISLSLIWIPKLEAKVSISPITKDSSGFVSSFVYNLEAGESITDKALLYNLAATDATVLVEPRDAQFSQEGVFTLKQTKDSSLLGKWITFGASTLAIPAQTNVEIPFTLTLPDDLSDGEYAGGLAIAQVQDQNPGVNVQTEVGSKVYILVGSDFKSSAKLENLSALHPSGDDYTQLSQKYNIPNKNLHLIVQGINEGNVFANMDGEFEITMAGGLTDTGQFKKNLHPQQNTSLIIPTNTVLQPGNVKVKITYTTAPTNLNYLPEGFNYDDSQKVLETEFEFKSSDYYKGIDSEEVADALEPKEVKTEKPIWMSLILNLTIGIGFSVAVVYGSLYGWKKYQQRKSNKAKKLDPDQTTNLNQQNK